MGGRWNRRIKREEIRREGMEEKEEKEKRE